MISDTRRMKLKFHLINVMCLKHEYVWIRVVTKYAGERSVFT